LKAPTNLPRERLILLVGAIVLFSCSGSPSLGGSGAPAATTEPRPTAEAASDEASQSPNPPLPLRAGAVARWGGAQVTTVCLVGSQVFPQEPDLRLPVTTWLKSLLTPVGIAVAGKAGPCDATLKVSVRIVATPANYGTDGVTRYTAGDRRVTVSLTAADRKPIVFEESASGTPSELASSSAPATPREFLANQSDAVTDDLLDATIQIWGLAPAVEALCLPEQQEPYVSFAFGAEQRLLDASDLRDALGGPSPVPNDYTSWRHWFETGEVVAGQGSSNGCR